MRRTCCIKLLMQQLHALLLLVTLPCKDLVLVVCSSHDVGLQLPSFALSENVTAHTACKGSKPLHWAERQHLLKPSEAPPGQGGVRIRAIQLVLPVKALTLRGTPGTRRWKTLQPSWVPLDFL